MELAPEDRKLKGRELKAPEVEQTSLYLAFLPKIFTTQKRDYWRGGGGGAAVNRSVIPQWVYHFNLQTSANRT